MINKKFKKFPKEKDLELSRKFKEEDDSHAFNELIENNMWIVKRIAFKFANRGVELDDLFQEGSIALFEDAKKFDYKMNCRLSTYAVFRIREYVTREIKRKSIHIPRYIQEAFSNIYKTKCFLEEKFRREASLKEISDKTGISVEKIKFIYENMNIYCTSLDALINYKKSDSSGNKQKSEVIGDVSFFSVEQLLILKEELEKIMEIVLDTINQFSKKNQSIFYEHLIHDKSFMEIAEKFSCWSSGIGQSMKKMLKILCIKLKKDGYEIKRGKIKNWLSDKIYLCYWLQETTGANFSILK